MFACRFNCTWRTIERKGYAVESNIIDNMLQLLLPMHSTYEGIPHAIASVQCSSYISYINYI